MKSQSGCPPHPDFIKLLFKSIYMSIIATTNSAPKELIPAGNYIARCYQMLQIGHVKEVIQGEVKTLNKVRIGWELPTETKVFSQEKGEQPFVISEEYTLSMHEKSNLRKVLASWRGKEFSEEEAKKFDISKLLGKPCMLNIIHKPSKDGSKEYEEIGSISPLPKGFECPAPVNAYQILDYENFDFDVLNKLPDFLKTMVQSSQEFKALTQIPVDVFNDSDESGKSDDGLPF